MIRVYFSITSQYRDIDLIKEICLFLDVTCLFRRAHDVIGRFNAFRPISRGFKPRSSRHVGTLGKSFTRSYLWRFGVKLRHSIRAVLGAPLSRWPSGLEG